MAIDFLNEMENTEVEISEVTLKLASVPNIKFLGCFISNKTHCLYTNTCLLLNESLYIKLWN